MIEILEPRVQLSGNTIVVDTTSDAASHTGTSLRDAVNQANADGSGDTITFDSSLNGQTIKLTQGYLNLSASMTITGNGASNTIIDGGWDGIGHVGSAIFNAQGSDTSMTITGITAQHGFGSAINCVNGASLTLTNDRISSNDAINGGIYNYSRLTMSNDTVTGNTGAGIENLDILVMQNTSITGNSSGGMFSTGYVTSLDNTYSGNSGGNGLLNYGLISSTNDTFANNTEAAIYSAEGNLITVNDTIVNNSGYNGSTGGIVLSPTWNWGSINTIVAGNAGGDVAISGANIRATATLIGDKSISGSGITNNVGYSTIFGSNVLANNGGPTQTVALIAGSPAIGAAASLTSLSADVASSNATTLTVNSTAFLDAGDNLKLDNEIVTVIAITGSTTLNVVRGQLGTFADTHSNGTAINLATDQRGLLRMSADIGAWTRPSASTSSTLTTSTSTSVYGQSVTFTDTVASQATGTPTGTVTFRDGSITLGTGTLSVVNGHDVATISTSTLAAGTHTIMAAYTGDTNFDPSTSATTQSVDMAGTTSTLSSSVTQAAFGQSLTLTETVGVVNPGAGTPTGTVTFKDGTTTLGVGTLSVVNGHDIATLSTSGLAVGTHVITAVYAGDSNFSVSTSGPLTPTVVMAATTSMVSSSASSAAFGQSVTLTATVGVVSPGAGSPTGTVIFYDGTTELGTGTLSAVNGNVVATFSTSSLVVGMHLVTAVYAGDSNFNTSTSAAITQTIAKARTTSTVVSSVSPAVFGQSVTLTETVGVISPGAGTPTGTVTFMDGSTTLGTGKLSVVNGSVVATYTTASLAVGNHSIAAIYGGDGNFSSSTSVIFTQTVGKANTTSTASSSIPNSVFGQSVTLYETVGVVGPGVGVPTGTVTFMDGGTTIGTGTLSLVDSYYIVASLTTSSLSVGNHSITVAYAGDGNFNGSTSAVFTQTVGKANTTSTVSSSTPNSVFGQSVTLYETVGVVSPGVGFPTGTVTFMDGGSTIGTGKLSVLYGVYIVASLTTSSLSVGNHSITVSYAGDGNFNGSTSAVFTQSVGKANTTSTASSSIPNSVFGQSVTLYETVGVVSPGVGVPTGTVIFNDGGTTIGTGTLSVVDSYYIVASLTTSSLSAGNHSITVVYTGDGNFNGSTSAVFTQSVAKASTFATLTSSDRQVTTGQSVTLTLKLGVASPGTGIPTGTVTFMDGKKVLGTATLTVVNGVIIAKFKVSKLTKGTHSITATYNGSANFRFSSATLKEIVT